MILLGSEFSPGPDDVPRRVRIIEPGDGSRHRGARGPRGACADQTGCKSQWLAMAVGVVEVKEPGPVAGAAARRCTGLPGLVSLLGVVELERLRTETHLSVRFKLSGHASHVIHHRTHRITRIGGRKRAVHHIDAFDFFRCH